MLTSYSRKAWILLVLALLLAGCNEELRPGEPFDPHIEGLELVEWISGDDAMKAINKLHGMPIDVVTGFIAHYKGPNEKATIWVSETTSEELAEEQIVIMIQKMKDNTRSPFSHYRDLNVRGLKVIAFDGMRQTHYVFRDNKWVYWISADEKRIDEILQHVHGNG
ncbi:MAG: hypothetical protein JRJ47_00650 [Deltaproteobacteria bacterium]|nr:hypothetical protein [Deltaproteobacteria bacterium]